MRNKTKQKVFRIPPLSPNKILRNFKSFESFCETKKCNFHANKKGIMRCLSKVTMQKNLFRQIKNIKNLQAVPRTITSNSNASETNANESFGNGVFFDIEAKRTPSIVSKLFSKRCEHIR
jgi:hypothetical protein